MQQSPIVTPPGFRLFPDLFSALHRRIADAIGSMVEDFRNKSMDSDNGEGSAVFYDKSFRNSMENFPKNVSRPESRSPGHATPL